MSRISGLSDLKKKNEEEKKNEFFAGGIDSHGGGSGLAIQGPPKPNPPSSSTFDRIVSQGHDAESMADYNPENDACKITLYRNGFVVNDGDLRDLTSPENRAFLDALSEGRVPIELRSSSSKSGGDVNVALVDKRSEDYVKTAAFKAYSGNATTLGTVSVSSSNIFDRENLANMPEIVVDESKPFTTIQVKLHDGQKLRLKLNHDTAITQLAGHIARVSNTCSKFSLSTGFPPVDISTSDCSILEAKLLGASITQKKL